MPVIGPSFTIDGIEPSGVIYAPDDQRRDYWDAVSEYVVEVWRDQLRAGLDAYGSPFAPLALSTIRNRHSDMWWTADPNAPPFIPAYDMSRTRSLFVAEANPALDGCVCYWEFDDHTGASWGEIMAYHREGNENLPVRDVFGLSPANLEIVRRRASDWWDGYVAGDDSQPLPPPPDLPPFDIWPSPDRIFTFQESHPSTYSRLASRRYTQITIGNHVFTFLSAVAQVIETLINNSVFTGWGIDEWLPDGGYQFVPSEELVQHAS